MANGILIIDKFQDWTSSGLGLIERETAGAVPLILAAIHSSSPQTRVDQYGRVRQNQGRPP